MITTIDPQMEERGAKLRLTRLVQYKNIELILVLCFKKKKSLHLTNKIEVQYLNIQFLDVLLILYAIIFKLRPITNSIFFRRIIYSKIEVSNYVLVHLVRCIPLSISKYKNIEIDVCESLSENYKIRSKMLPWFSLKKYIFYYDSRRLKDLELSVRNLRTYFINASDPLIPYMKDHMVITNINKLNPKKCRLVVQKKILFIGHVDYEPNLKCLLTVCEVIKGSNYRLEIYGTITKSNQKLFSKYSFVKISGYVENLFSIKNNYVCGISYMVGATGTQNKVFDYIRLGLPALVSSDLKGLEKVESFICRVELKSKLLDVLDKMHHRKWRAEYNTRIEDFYNVH